MSISYGVSVVLELEGQVLTSGLLIEQKLSDLFVSDLDVAGAIPFRLALDLVQSLVHDTETMARQGYHGLLVTLDVNSVYPRFSR